MIVDLHIHSHYSRATSKECCLEGLQKWAQLKGIRVLGTGDFTHPAWIEELREKLIASSPGLFRLHPQIAAVAEEQVPESCRGPVDFMLTGEISSIYKRGGKVRKVHSLLLAPDFETVEKINRRLDEIGNIKSDGRPILGLDVRDLLEIVLEANPEAVLIPAHIWTPWFSLFGSKSGFDSIEECFGDLSEHVFAIETGLSSDVPMNWRVRDLDRITLISNSDIHSPSNLGRNATVLNCEPDYFSIREAFMTKGSDEFGGTIDMFPEEGKYHLDGHRKCEVVLKPRESLARNSLCPVCEKPLTLGVLHRVEELAGRPEGEPPPEAAEYRYIIPLAELLSEIIGYGPKSKRVQAAYHESLEKLGPEMDILLHADLGAVAAAGPPLLAEAVKRLRCGQVIRSGGFDGVYGTVRVFGDDENVEKLRLKAVHDAFLEKQKR